mgnify:CR=1 FL=1
MRRSVSARGTLGGASIVEVSEEERAQKKQDEKPDLVELRHMRAERGKAAREELADGKRRSEGKCQIGHEEERETTREAFS